MRKKVIIISIIIIGCIVGILVAIRITKDDNKISYNEEWLNEEIEKEINIDSIEEPSKEILEENIEIDEIEKNESLSSENIQNEIKDNKEEKATVTSNTSTNIKQEVKENEQTVIKENVNKNQEKVIDNDKNEIPKSEENKSQQIKEETIQKNIESKNDEKVASKYYQINEAMIEKIKNTIEKNVTDDMKKYGYSIVVDSSIKEKTNQFTFTENRVKAAITNRFGTIRIYAEDYYVDGQLIMTECYIF